MPLISDEAYIEYAGLDMSNVDLVNKYPNVLITRTMSKAYGLPAGLRFGYALGHKDVIAQISGALLPWNVGTIPMWAGMAGFEDQEALKQRVEFNNDQVRCYEQARDKLKAYHLRQLHPVRRRDGKTGKGMLDFAAARPDLPGAVADVRAGRLVPHHHRQRRRKPDGHPGHSGFLHPIVDERPGRQPPERRKLPGFFKRPWAPASMDAPSARAESY